MKSGLFSCFLFTALLALPKPSFASGDSIDWTLLAHDPDPDLTEIGTAYLHPQNDTRINLSLLLQDHKPLTTQRTQMPAFDDSLAPMGIGFYIEEQKSNEAAHSAAAQTQLQHLNIPTEVITQAKSRMNNWREGRCVSDTWNSLHQFLSQLELAGLKEDEAHELGLARLKLAGTCPAGLALPIEMEFHTPAAKEFALYLKAAAAFYAGTFTDAGEQFKSLSEAKTPWLQETAHYMLGRVYLNVAQQGAADTWGLFAKDAINLAQLSSASQAFNAYLKRYPEGNYAASAKGFARKIAWLGQNQEDLTNVYGQQFKESILRAPYEGVISLINEIDSRYWFLSKSNSQKATIFIDEPNWQVPEFAAVAVLVRQRIFDAGAAEKDRPAPFAISPAVINPHLPQFKKLGQEKLGQYLLLSHQFFVQRNYTAVVEATTGITTPEKLTNVDFSTLYLRGLALEKTQQTDKAYELWKSLASNSKSSGSRIQSQIALIIHLAENDKLKEAFLENSLIDYAPIRKPAITYSANAQVLEYIVQAKHTSIAEKREALFQLVRKNLLYQQYAEALRLIKLYPLENYALGDIYNQDHPSFPSTQKLADDLQQRLDKPKDLMALVNIAFRYQNHHITDQTQASAGPGRVGGFAAKWAGDIKSPLQIFQQVIADNQASADVKAKALSGAINCFRRVGANRCDAQGIPVAQRKAWFKTLKKTYGNSPWAEMQEFYW